MASLKTDGMAILIVFIGVLIAVTFLPAIADSVVGQTSTQTLYNVTTTVPAVNATTDLTGRDLVTQIYVQNATSGAAVTGVNLQTAIGTGGLQTVQITANDSGSTYAAESVNISYTYNPNGYLNNSGARSVSLLIILFGALAIVVFALVMFIKRGSLGELMRRK